MNATVHERGNGLPDVGDFVAGNDGEVYVVTALIGQIQTGRPGQSNWMHAEVDLADWSDVDDDNEPTCSAVLDDDEVEVTQTQTWCLDGTFHNLAVAILVDGLWDGGDLDEATIDVLCDAAQQRLAPDPDLTEGEIPSVRRVTQAVHAKMQRDQEIA